MGFLLWAALTALAWAAGWALVIRFANQLRIGEMLVGSCVAAVAIVLAAIEGTGYASVLHPWTVALVVVAISGGLFAWARPTRAQLQATRARFRIGVGGALWGGGGALASLLVLALTLLLATYVYLLPSWGWDAMWYHDAISAYAYQEHTLGWVNTWIPFVNSYPKGIELLSLWNVLFAPDARLLDGAQLPLVLLGTVALAAMCRNAGAKPALAWGLGLLWMLMPAVWLNAPTNYNDAGSAGLWLAAVLFLGRLDAQPAHRLFGALALGAYAGSKVSGLLHTVMIAPLVVLALALEWRRTRATKSLLAQFAASIAGIFLLGGATYVRDLVKFGNPFWPAQVKVPLLGTNFFPFDPHWRITDFTTPPFGGPDDFNAMWRSFNEAHPVWLADVRLGGFGTLWLYALLPAALVAIVFALVQLARRQPTPGAIAVAIFLLTSVATPAHWWPRYTLGFPAAGLLGCAILVQLLPRAWLQQLVLVGLCGWSAWQAWPARQGLLTPRDPPGKVFDVLASAAKMTPEQRDDLKLDNWQQPGIALRDQVVQPGEASAYDSSTSFVYQLWRRDWQNRVLYLPLEDGMDPQAWLRTLDAERVRWASFARGSRAERTLRDAGWRPLWACGSEGCGVWLRPGTEINPAPAR